MAVKNDERQFEADIEEMMTSLAGRGSAARAGLSRPNSVSISTSSFVL